MGMSRETERARKCELDVSRHVLRRLRSYRPLDIPPVGDIIVEE